MQNDWQKEFPTLYKLKKTPKSFFADALISLDKKVKQLVFFGTILLMTYLFYFHLTQYFQTQDLTKMTDYFTVTDYGMEIWKAYRNFLFGLLTFDFLLSVVVGFILIYRKNTAKTVATGLSWWWLMLFLTFSYAITELISKFVVWLAIF